MFANAPLKTFKRKAHAIELDAKQLKGIEGLKKRRAHMHNEEHTRVNDNVNPYVAEHRDNVNEAQSEAAKLQARRTAAKVSAEKETCVFRMNSHHNGADKLVRGVTDGMPLHYKAVSSIWEVPFPFKSL